MRILLQGPRYACSLLSELNRCRLSRRYCDVLLQVGNRTFAAHRAVLSCAGAYFCDLFSRGTPDSSPSAPNASVFNLEFISPANFEKVLTFVYTGEILIDLIDVGVLYDLAERLGIGELVGACHATFPDLQTNCKNSPLHVNSSNNEAAACSSAASSSSLSSLTPASRDSPFPQSRVARSNSVTLKLENNTSFGQTERRLPAPSILHDTGDLHCKNASVESTLQLKTEQDFSEGEDKQPEQILPKLQCESESPSSVGALGGLQVVSVQGAVDGDVFSGGEEGNGAMEVTEEDEQWRQLAGEIIELSDDETFLEEKEEDEEDDLVCVENGANPSVQDAEDLVPCRVCALKLPLDPGAVRVHAESHLTESGQCVVCGLLYSDAETGLNHVLSHVGVQLFGCAMCHSHFSTRAKLLRHVNRSSASYSLPPAVLSNSAAAGSSCELQCGQCGKVLSKDFQSVREHVLAHVSLLSLCCSVCQLPQTSPCPLLWHGLSHMSVPAFTCPHCAMCFVERPLLDRHMSVHAEEAAAKERERSLLRAYTFSANGSDPAVSEELRCLFCPQTFTSSSAFHSHLSAHTTDTPHTSAAAGGANGSLLLGKRKAQDPTITMVTCQGSSSSLPSLRDIGGLLKMSNVGFQKGFPGFSQSLGQDGTAKAKWYRCRYCGKSFAHSGEFTYHLRIHTGEKPYQCKVCLRFFRGRSTMICHLKTHAGAMMYRCTVCGLFFSTLKMVSSHMELHREHLPPDFNIEQTFMYNDHSKEPLMPPADT